MQRFENRLDQNTKEYDRLQNDYQILAEEIQRKRRALNDLENELRNKKRKHAEQHAILEHNTDLTRAEYQRLRDELDKLAYTLRFSVEEELKIYEALLNSFQRKKEQQSRLPIDDSKYHQTKTTTTTRFMDTLSSGAESTGFRRSQPSISETSRIFTTQTNIDDAVKYRPKPIPTPISTPIIKESIMTTTTKTTKQQNDNAIPVIRIDQVKEKRKTFLFLKSILYFSYYI